LECLRKRWIIILPSTNSACISELMPSGSRATATKGDPLRGAINADAFRALRLRAGLAAVPRDHKGGTP
jgi:hypothetical protein